jgi:tetratricopeptide (TPR) repeat protein
MPEDNGQDQELSAERKAAEMLMQQAREQLEHRHHAQAIELAREALQADPSHLQIRHFIAKLYEDTDQVVRASREYQEIITANNKDQEAWEALRRIDPPAAERLTRLQEVAEDPFMSKAKKDIGDDFFTSIGDDDDEEEEYEEAPGVSAADELSLEPTEEAADVVSELSADASEPTFDEPELSLDEPEIAAEEEAAPLAAAAPQGPPWVHEQEAEFRRRLLDRPNVSMIVKTLDDMREDMDAWEPVFNECVHMDRERNITTRELFEELSEFFGVECPQLFLAAERRMIPSLFNHDPLSLAVTTGMLSAYNTEEEQRFAFGRTLAHLAMDACDCINVSITVLQRIPTGATDVEEAIAALLDRKAAGWDIGVPREELITTRKIAHAWEQRAVLSCDRAGLLACGDLDAACLAIAKATARTSDLAEKMTFEEFVADYRDEMPRQLAAIDEKQCPLRSGHYSAYRILMLKWWAGTDQYAQLRGA